MVVARDAMEVDHAMVAVQDMDVVQDMDGIIKIFNCFFILVFLVEVEDVIKDMEDMDVMEGMVGAGDDELVKL